MGVVVSVILVCMCLKLDGNGMIPTVMKDFSWNLFTNQIRGKGRGCAEPSRQVLSLDTVVASHTFCSSDDQVKSLHEINPIDEMQEEREETNSVVFNFMQAAGLHACPLYVSSVNHLNKKVQT